MSGLFVGFLFFVIIIFVVTFLFMFNPKIRGGMMKSNMKSVSSMLSGSEGSLESLTESMIKMKKNIIENNEEDLKELSRKSAEIRSDGVEITARAIKKGLTTDEGIFCKYCGKKIDADSQHCKYCGKEL